MTTMHPAIHKLDYTNYEGRRAIREVQVLDTYFGSFPPYHNEPQWLMKVWDLDKKAERVYAQSGIHAVDGVPTGVFVDDPTRCLIGHCDSTAPKCPMGVGCRSNLGLEDLVARFSRALLEKLKHSETKRGWSGEWLNLTETSARYEMAVHLRKGDPLDIAAFAAFMWHHSFTTEGPEDTFRARFEQAVNLTHAAQIDAKFKCKALANINPNDPQNCGWPTCGCDPYADRVLDSLQESGQMTQRPEKGQEL